MDMLSGKPYDYSLVDSATKACGNVYTNNRQRVLVLMEAGVPIPRWNVVSKVPSKIRAAIHLADQIEANRSPEERVRPVKFKPTIGAV
jgi:hypothetical protein